jgi:hypothetical protein
VQPQERLRHCIDLIVMRTVRERSALLDEIVHSALRVAGSEGLQILNNYQDGGDAVALRYPPGPMRAHEFTA